MKNDLYDYEKLDTLSSYIEVPKGIFEYNNLSESISYANELKERLNIQLGLKLVKYLEDKQDENLRFIINEGVINPRDSTVSTYHKEINVFKKRPDNRRLPLR